MGYVPDECNVAWPSFVMGACTGAPPWIQYKMPGSRARSTPKLHGFGNPSCAPQVSAVSVASMRKVPSEVPGR